jgi:exonuclease III
MVFSMAAHHMNNSREMTILCHNIRGIISDVKHNSIINKIQELGCDIICLQETKRENFDASYLKKICPKAFDCFSSTPSVGASSGTITIWKGSKLQGEVVFENEYAKTVQFMSKLNGQKWILTNIYATCTPDGKLSFLRRFKNIQMPDDCLWIVLGDFNLIRRPDNRNKPGGDNSLMHAFNEAISKLGLLELPLSDQQFTWTNSQQNPQLERLDWFFVS